MAEEKILIVEDQPEILEPMRLRVSADGYQVITATNGVEALERFAEAQPDLVILDVMIPKLDGLSVCRRIRAQSEVPILILSAKSEEANVVAGLEVGADDYVTKPFRVNELLARIRSLLRRAEARSGNGSVPDPAPDDPPDPDILLAGPITINTRTYTVDAGGRRVLVTPIEYRLLVELARKGGEVMSRQEILQAVWGYEGYDLGLVNTHIKRLRDKLEEDPNQPQIIVNVRGFGYRLAM